MTAELDLLMTAVSRFGGRPNGGVARLAASAEDGAARDWFADHIRRSGLESVVDPVGNLFGVAHLAPTSREAVFVGSHLDSQPTGGRYDGTYGVVAGLLATVAVARRAVADPGAARRNLVVADWTNEEGARFQPSLIGSSVHAGLISLEAAWAATDPDGIRLGDALAAIGYRGEGGIAFDPVRYVELHVEQGGVLESAGVDIGVVTGAWAARKLTVDFLGAPAHTGPTPMARRRDALRAAARAIEHLHAAVEESGTGAHASAAKIRVEPNSPNVVPERVRVWFEIRHRDNEVTRTLGERFLALIAADARDLGVETSVCVDQQRPGVDFDDAGIALSLEAAAELGLSAMTLATISGHDVLALRHRAPVSLIFVPSRDGLSHSPAEFTGPEALAKGAAVLEDVLWRLVTAD